MKKKRMLIAVLVGAMCLSLVLAGCGNVTDDQNGEEKQTVEIGYVNWAEGIAMTNLAKAILEDKMGYEVNMTMTDVAPLFASLASGGTDVFLDAWLPITHASYMEEYGEKIEDHGYNFENAKIGLVVPSYVEINSIEELNDAKDEFDATIVGIDSGAGIMSTTETAIQDYGLEYDLMPGSGPTMTAALKKAIDANEAIVVTGWSPHWMFARFDLKYLDDPKGTYGEAEYIHTLTRAGFGEDMPEVTQFLENFFMDESQLGDLMGAIADSDEDPLEAARTWMNENEELVNSWIPAE